VTTRERLTRRLRPLVFGVATGLLVVGALELLLWAAARASPRIAILLSPGIPLALSDPVLGERPNPQVPDHDAAGWRNAARPDRARVVAIGDSQTYGQIVAREEAWPQRLEARTGVRVYNMALGGYGPVQYLRLVGEALALAPELVLVGFYSGNDLFGSYSAVYAEDREPALRASAPEVVAALAEAEAAGPSLVGAWDRTRAARAGRLAAWAPLLDPLRAHSRLWGLARAARRLLDPPQPGVGAGAAATSARAPDGSGDPALLFPVGAEGTGTVLTPLQRRAVLDPSDPRIAEGLRISLEALARMGEACAARCEVVAVLLPTKELVFEDLVARGGAPPPRELDELLRDEKAMWAATRRALATRGLRFVDALPALRAALARGENPYPADWNGHLNALGNDLVADAVAGSAPFRELVGAGRAASGAAARTEEP
jgi:hypothetical protein